MHTLTTQALVAASKGNPGAATAMAEMIKSGYEISVITLIGLGIKGTDIYVLWSDICGRDCHKLKKLIDAAPDDILIDAASRQDYSGRQLVAEYMS